MLSVFAALATPAAAQVSDPLDIFAACAGRLSAEVEFRWLMQVPADEAEEQRAAMLDLVEALAGPAPGPEVMALRINAKVAHRALLGRSVFNADAADAVWARARARAARRACTDMLLVPGA